MPKNTMHRPCVPPRDSRRFSGLSLAPSLSPAASLFCYLSPSFEVCVYHRVLAHPQRVCRYLRWKSRLLLKIHARSPTRALFARVCLCRYVRRFVRDRTRLNCGYHKSTMPRVSYALRAFQRLSSSYARNGELYGQLYVSPRREEL